MDGIGGDVPGFRLQPPIATGEIRDLNANLAKVAVVLSSHGRKDLAAQCDRLAQCEMRDGELQGVRNELTEAINKLSLNVGRQLAELGHGRANRRLRITCREELIALNAVRGIAAEEGVPDPLSLETYIDAQRTIVLGFRADVEAPPAQVRGIHFGQWSSWGPRQDNAGWGPVFAERIGYVEANRGSITFLYPERSNRFGIVPPFRGDIAAVALDIWTQTWTTTAAEGGENRMERAYGLFQQTFRRVYPVEGDAIGVAAAFRAASAPDAEELPQGTNGETTYFEFAFLLHRETGHDFTLHATDAQFADLAVGDASFNARLQARTRR